MSSEEVNVGEYGGLPLTVDVSVAKQLASYADVYETLYGAPDRRVVVVCNGPSVAGSGLGAWIDAHEVVVRVNRASVDEEHTADVGSKCTVHCCWARVVNRGVRVGPKTPIGEQVWIYETTRNRVDVAVDPLWGTRKMWGTDDKWLDRLRASIGLSRKQYPSTGAVAICRAIELHGAVDVIGHDCFVQGSRSTYAYEDKRPPSGLHDFDLERSWLESEKRAGRVFAPEVKAEHTDYKRIYEDMYRQGYNNHAQAWGVRTGMLPWMVEHCDFRTVLDVGCGRGQDVAWLLAEGKDAHGVDVAPAAMAALDAKRFSVRDLASDVGWGRNTYDAVVSSDVLEHIRPEDVPAALRRMVNETRRFVGIRAANFKSRAGDKYGYGTEIVHPTLHPPRWWIEQLGHAAAECGRWMRVKHTDPKWFVAEFKE